IMAIAMVLTLCSTSDPFLPATFVSFPLFARMAFMVFGPMFDLKLFFLYSVLFKKRFVIGLGIGLFVLIGLICSRLLIYVYAGQALFHESCRNAVCVLLENASTLCASHDSSPFLVPGE